ncbi:MAG: GGDEF domain-containing protein [Pseudomonadota bacterium]
MLGGPYLSEDLRRAYAAELNPEKTRICRIMLIMAMLLNTCFALLDVYALPSAVEEAWQIRLIMNLTILGCLACTWQQYFAKFYGVVTLIALISLGAGINRLIALSSPGDIAASAYYGGLLLIIFGLFTLTYLNIWVSLAVSAVLLTNYVLVAVHVHNYLAVDKQVTLLTNLFFFVATTVIGIVVMSIRDRYAKENFLLRQTLTRDMEMHAARAKAVAKRAARDSLTDMLNRVGFEQAFADLLATAPACVELLFIDLDHFKPINDVHGHAAGDRVLQEISLRIAGVLPENAIAGRLGGDEFVVAVPGLASYMPEIIQRAVETPLRLRGGDITLSCSIGVARYPEHADELEALMQHADADMYRAKRARRGSAFAAPA